MNQVINWSNNSPLCNHPIDNCREIFLSSKPIGWVSSGYMFVAYIIDNIEYDKPVLFGGKRESIAKYATHAKFIEV